MNDKHTDDIAGRMRTKECCLGSGSESLDRSSLLVSCKTRFQCFEPLCIDVMAKEMKDNAWKTKKNIKESRWEAPGQIFIPITLGNNKIV